MKRMRGLPRVTRKSLLLAFSYLALATVLVVSILLNTNNEEPAYIALIACGLIWLGVFVAAAIKARNIKDRFYLLGKYVIWAGILFALLFPITKLSDEIEKRYIRDTPTDFPFSCSSTDFLNCAEIEDHAKVDVSLRSETKALVNQYGSTKVTVRALAYSYISDPDYTVRLLGGAHPEVHCIIFVDWPDGQRIYVETSYHEYAQYTPAEFIELIKDAPAEDINALYANLH